MLALPPTHSMINSGLNRRRRGYRVGAVADNGIGAHGKRELSLVVVPGNAHDGTGTEVAGRGHRQQPGSATAKHGHLSSRQVVGVLDAILGAAKSVDAHR